jgi:hypothetical protein
VKLKMLGLRCRVSNLSTLPEELTISWSFSPVNGKPKYFVSDRLSFPRPFWCDLWNSPSVYKLKHIIIRHFLLNSTQSFSPEKTHIHFAYVNKSIFIHLETESVQLAAIHPDILQKENFKLCAAQV